MFVELLVFSFRVYGVMGEVGEVFWRSSSSKGGDEFKFGLRSLFLEW